MGPRSIDRGNPVSLIADESHFWLQWGRDQLIAETTGLPEGFLQGEQLQWGRDQLIAETAHIEPSCYKDPVASMGPRSIDRGNFDPERRYVPGSGASMGPRSIDRGNTLGGICGHGSATGFNGAAIN